MRSIRYDTKEGKRTKKKSESAIVEWEDLVGESGDGSSGSVADEEHDRSRLPLTSGRVGRESGKGGVGRSCRIEDEGTGSGRSARASVGADSSELGVDEFRSRDSSTVETSNRSEKRQIVSRSK